MYLNEFDNSIAMTIGDDEQLNVHVSGQYSYTPGDIVLLTVKRHADDEEPLFLRAASLDSAGTASIGIISEDTAGADPGAYCYSVRLIMATDQKTIIPYSKFILIPEV